MRLSDIAESSPLTFHGSISKDLLLSKIWLCTTLKKLGFDQFKTIYILGSWYGIMAYTLDRCNINFDRIINVDTNKEYLDFSNSLLRHLDGVVSISKDANKLNYTQIEENSLVINTSTTEMKNEGWLQNIPIGTLVAIQGRNDVDDASSLKKFDKKYPLSKTLYLNKKTLKDPEVKYQRFMKIGIK